MLNMIDTIYQNKKNILKEEIRQYIRNKFEGKVVCTTYGNYKTYKILDFEFDRDLNDITFSN